MDWETLGAMTLQILSLWLMLALCLLDASLYFIRARYLPNRPEPVQGQVALGLAFLSMGLFYVTLLLLPSADGRPDDILAAIVASRISLFTVLILTAVSNINAIFNAIKDNDQGIE